RSAAPTRTIIVRNFPQYWASFDAFRRYKPAGTTRVAAASSPIIWPGYCVHAYYRSAGASNRGVIARIEAIMMMRSCAGEDVRRINNRISADGVGIRTAGHDLCDSVHHQVRALNPVQAG